MLKKTIVFFLVPVFLLNIIGCYTSNTVSGGNIDMQEDTILSISLFDGEEIIFKGAGGKIFQKAEGIEGVHETDKPFFMHTSNIKEMYKNEFIPVDLATLKQEKVNFLLKKNNVLVEFNKASGIVNHNKKIITGTSVFGDIIEINFEIVKEAYQEKPQIITLDELKNNSDLSVQSLITQTNLLVKFDKHGGKYSPSGLKIKGITEKGNSIEVNFNEVKSAEIRTGDTLLTIGFILSAIAVLFSILLLAANYSL